MVVTRQPAAHGQPSTVSGEKKSSQPRVKGNETTLNMVWFVTCSWSSASRCALSSSESSVEDSDSEEESLELSDDEATGGGWGFTGAGW